MTTRWQYPRNIFQYTPEFLAIHLQTVLHHSKVLYIGEENNIGSFLYDGYMDEIRISKGIARWTSNFTPPQASYSNKVSTFQGAIEPSVDEGDSLGSIHKRWGEIYTSDLHLANERGDWTVIEESEYLTISNNKSGKRYKLLMEEI